MNRSIRASPTGLLYSAYTRLASGDVVTRLKIIDRLYVLGSFAVRLGRCPSLHDLVTRTMADSPESTYTYSSWIRHGQVKAARANLFPENRGGLMISAARELLAEHPAMRPDIADKAVPESASLAHDDALFNSLCQFDILYCLVIAAADQNHGGAYPASSAMHQYRADPALELVATNEDARRALFPDLSDAQVAKAIVEVFGLAQAQSRSHGGHWWTLPPQDMNFVENAEVSD